MIINKNTMLSIVIFTSFSSLCIAEYLKFQHPTQALEIVAPYLPDNPVVVEAGAFDGTDTLFMAQRWQNGIIHAFEPVPEIYKLLKKQATKAENIRIYEMALSDQVGQALFYLSHEKSNPHAVSQSSSLLAPKEHLAYAPHIAFKKTIMVKTTTLDAWAQQHAISHADLLWLDMQGFELPALKASPNILKTVKAILTEVEFVEAYEKQSLYAEIKSWLEEQGFTLIATNFSNQSGEWFGDALFVRN